jgi:hypothetical protein
MPRERTEQPSSVYRALIQLSCVLVFPSAAYDVRLMECAPSGRHQLTGYDHARAVEVLVSPAYRSHPALVAAFLTTGFAVRVDTIGATILRRMVRDRWVVVR